MLLLPATLGASRALQPEDSPSAFSSAPSSASSSTSAQVLDLTSSNAAIRSLILGDKPFLVGRLGLGSEPVVAAATMAGQLVTSEWLQLVQSQAGVYPSDEPAVVRDFAQLYTDAIASADLMARWGSEPFGASADEKIQAQDGLIAEHCTGRSGCQMVHTRALEPWYLIDASPWSELLANRTVLVVHPFEDSIRTQFLRREQIWPGERGARILPSLQLRTVRPVSSISGWRPHANWSQSLDTVLRSIDKLDGAFDVALVAAGSYGMPLAAAIKRMGKGAIYVGGGLQLMFGIKGERWAHRTDLQPFFTSSWVCPSSEELNPAAREHGLDDGGGASNPYWCS